MKFQPSAEVGMVKEMGEQCMIIETWFFLVLLIKGGRGTEGDMVVRLVVLAEVGQEALNGDWMELGTQREVKNIADLDMILLVEGIDEG